MVSGVLFACSTGGGTGFDASTDSATQDAGCAVCTVSIADYCQAKTCASNEGAAVAQLCATSTVVTVCGGLVESVNIDTGFGYVYEDGGLTTVFDFANGSTCCVAGTLGSDVSSLGCAFNGNACTKDAGAD